MSIASSLAPIRVHYQDPGYRPYLSKVPSTQSRSRSRSRSPVARRKSPPRHSPPFRSVTPPPRHSSPSRSVTPVMDEAEAADGELGSDCNLLDLMCGWKRREAARSPVPPVTRSPRRSDAEVQVRPADRRNNRSVTGWTRKVGALFHYQWLEVQTDTV